MTDEGDVQWLAGAARFSREVGFALETRGCSRCGCRADGLQQLKSWLDHEKREVEEWHLECPDCGLRRRVRFFIAPSYDGSSHRDWPRDHLGGPEPSSVIEPHEFIREFDYNLSYLREVLSHVPPTDHDWPHNSSRSRECMVELAKFFTNESDRIPEAHFRTPEAKRQLAEHPEHFRRAFLDEMRARHRDVQVLIDREVARRDAASEQAPPPSLGRVAPFSQAHLKRHAYWLAGKPAPLGEQMRLANLEATEKPLSTADLSSSILENVVLDRADLSFATLHGATWTGVLARGAGFRSAMLAGTKLRRCDFTAAGMPIARFGDATVEDCTFAGANLERTTWYRARVERCSFVDAVLQEAAFDKATFADCDFRGADFSIVRNLLGTGVDARFVRCDLRDTKWSERDLFRVAFIECKLAGSSGRPSIARTTIERPDLSPAGDGSVIGTERDVWDLWGVDPAAPSTPIKRPAAPVEEAGRWLTYDLAPDIGHAFADALVARGLRVEKEPKRLDAELTLEVRVWEDQSTPIAAVVDGDLARLRTEHTRQASRNEERIPVEYIMAFSGITAAQVRRRPAAERQRLVETLLDVAIDRGEPFDAVVRLLLEMGYSEDEAHRIVIDPSAA